MIVRLETLPAGELAREQAGRERHPGQYSDFAALRFPKETFRGTLPEHVVDHLYGLDVRILERLEPFFDALDADTVVANLTLADEIVERCEGLRLIVYVRRRAVDLEQVEAVDSQVRQAAF